MSKARFHFEIGGIESGIGIQRFFHERNRNRRFRNRFQNLANLVESILTFWVVIHFFAGRNENRMRLQKYLRNRDENRVIFSESAHFWACYIFIQSRIGTSGPKFDNEKFCLSYNSFIFVVCIFCLSSE